MQYPHTIVISWKEPTTQNEDGYPVVGEDVSHTFDCRAEANERGHKTAGDDGILIDYAYDVYMPLTDVVIPRGAKFVLNDGAESVGQVKRAKNNQFNSKVWL